MADRGPPAPVQDQVVVPIEEADLLERHLQGLGGQAAEVVGGQPLPARLPGQVERGRVHQSAWLQADPLAPVQTEPRADQPHAARLGLRPFAFVQGIPVGIGRQDSLPVRAVEDEMPGREPPDAAAARREVGGIGEIGWTGEGAGTGENLVEGPIHGLPYSRSWPDPSTIHLKQVSSSRPMGPRAWMRVVLMPISAPNPNW